MESSFSQPPAQQAQAGGGFCAHCGAAHSPQAAVCLNCGAAIGHAVQSAVVPAGKSPKSPVVAVLLSFLWPGAGQLYAGDSSGKTIAFLVAAGVLFLFYLTLIGLILLPLGLILAIVSMIDARNVAREWNVRNGFDPSGSD